MGGGGEEEVKTLESGGRARMAAYLRQKHIIVTVSTYCKEYALVTRTVNAILTSKARKCNCVHLL